MTNKALIKQLETACYGLDPIDPIRLLVDDVIEALTQPELCKYGQEPKSCTSSQMDCQCAIDAALAQPQRTWVGLTDEEYTHITDTVFHTGQGLVAYYKAIEARLKEKNNA